MAGYREEVLRKMPLEARNIMALDLYKYQPLNRQKHDIRLLKIENSAELAESTFALDELVKGG